MKRKLTLKQLLRKFPYLEINSNCLTDMVCTCCGSRGGFYISLEVIGDVSDDGSSADDSDHEWKQSSKIRCQECGYIGIVKDFNFKGLDALLLSRLKPNVALTRSRVPADGNKP